MTELMAAEGAAAEQRGIDDRGAAGDVSPTTAALRAVPAGGVRPCLPASSLFHLQVPGGIHRRGTTS